MSRRAGRAFFVVWALLGIANMTLLLSVLTDAWQARYKSSIKKGRFKRVIRRINRKKSESPTAPARQEGSGVTQLLAEEGYVPLGAEGDGTPLAPEELPDKLVQTVRGFHAHARYFMVRACSQSPLQTTLSDFDVGPDSSAVQATRLGSSALCSKPPRKAT